MLMNDESEGSGRMQSWSIIRLDGLNGIYKSTQPESELILLLFVCQANCLFHFRTFDYV